MLYTHVHVTEMFLSLCPNLHLNLNSVFKTTIETLADQALKAIHKLK